MENEIEEIVLDQIQEGNMSACRFLVDKYQDYAYNLAYQLLKNREDAEEVAQDSFLKAFNHLSSFNRQAKFSTWLYRIVYNASLSKLRKKQLQQRPLHEASDLPVTGADFGSSLEVLNQEDRNVYLAKALDSLNEPERVLITLFYLQEKSMEEVSGITGLTISNVKVKIHRIRKKLQKQLVTLLKEEAKELL
ncbi:RNA polymerase sigma factor [Limibacter armeniacum]|uniref:RNA polymerase sigma factor n=1 Tax=Limibacter armeniacum TaxID=466084 RepID=UPI002FE688DF